MIVAELKHTRYVHTERIPIYSTNIIDYVQGKVMFGECLEHIIHLVNNKLPMTKECNLFVARKQHEFKRW